MQLRRLITMGALCAIVSVSAYHTADAEYRLRPKDHAQFMAALAAAERTMTASANNLTTAANVPVPDHIRLGLNQFPQTPFDHNEITPTGAVRYQQGAQPMTSPVTQPALVHLTKEMPQKVMITIPMGPTETGSTTEVAPPEPVMISGQDIPLQREIFKPRPVVKQVTQLDSTENWTTLQSTLSSEDGAIKERVMRFKVLPSDLSKVNVKTNVVSTVVDGTVQRGINTAISYDARLNNSVYQIIMNITSPARPHQDFTFQQVSTVEEINELVPAYMNHIIGNTKSRINYSTYLDTDRWFAGASTTEAFGKGRRAISTVISNTMNTDVAVTVMVKDDRRAENARNLAYTLAKHVQILDLVQ